MAPWIKREGCARFFAHLPNASTSSQTVPSRILARPAPTSRRLLIGQPKTTSSCLSNSNTAQPDFISPQTSTLTKNTRLTAAGKSRGSAEALKPNDPESVHLSDAMATRRTIMYQRTNTTGPFHTQPESMHFPLPTTSILRGLRDMILARLHPTGVTLALNK
jgi:hypothetical protein